MSKEERILRKTKNKLFEKGLEIHKGNRKDEGRKGETREEK